MNVLVLGGTGATGQWVVKDLLAHGHNVVALVRNTQTLARSTQTLAQSDHGLAEHSQLTQIQGTALSLDESTLSEQIALADAVISCLGHNLTLKGMYGAPQKLVTDSLQRIVNLTDPNRAQPLKIVLMNSSGVRNLDQPEPVSCGQHIVLGLLRVLIPPHRDNEHAANYLRTQCANIPHIQWVSVRPDSLVNSDAVSHYDLHPAPTRSAIFDAGKVSRINVANLMSRLVREDSLWETWRGKMPVIYNN